MNSEKSTYVRLLREWKRDLYWIGQALRPHMAISIKTDWQPKYRLWRYMLKSNCMVCGKKFREIEEGAFSRREQLCGDHCIMTTEEIAAFSQKTLFPPLP